VWGPPPESTDAKRLTLAVQVNFVQVPFTVKDKKGVLVPGITWRDVRVYENGLRQHLQLFTADPVPLSVALVIDQSMTFDTMTRVNNALVASGCLRALRRSSHLHLQQRAAQQTDFTGGQSARLNAVLERSKSVGREPLMPLGGPLSQTTNINQHELRSEHRASPQPSGHRAECAARGAYSERRDPGGSAGNY